MESRCKGLDEDDPSGYSLNSMLHILTPTPISSVEALIRFEVITLQCYNMSFSIDDISYVILTGDISYMGSLYSKTTLRKISAAVIIQ